MAETFKSATKENATQDITNALSNIYTVPSANSPQARSDICTKPS